LTAVIGANVTVCQRRYACGKTSKVNPLEVSSASRALKVPHEILLERISKRGPPQFASYDPKRSVRPNSFYTRDDKVHILSITLRPTREQGQVHASFCQVPEQIDRAIAKNLQSNVGVLIVEAHSQLRDPFEILAARHTDAEVSDVTAIFFQDG